ALMSDVELPVSALRAQLASAIDLIVQTARVRDGSRCVTHITEVSGVSDRDTYVLHDVFVRRPKGSGMGPLNPTGHRPQCADDLEMMGLHLPACIEAARRGGAQAPAYQTSREPRTSVPVEPSDSQNPRFSR
ncbi:MAG: hypothetical protein OXR73_33995, partial [Myxococcales bacterium]|nr:hypothetical protein [Myxococcales bacterium]